MKLKNIIIGVAALAAATLFVVSCTKENVPDVPVVPSTENDLITLRFDKSANPSLPSTVNALYNDRIVYVTIPKGISLTSLKPSMEVSPKASVKINNIPITNGVTAVDFSNTVSIVVTSESGLTKTYKALVQNGVSSLDNMIISFMKKYSIPGTSYAISKNEQIVYSTGIGFAATESDTRATASSLYRLASCSKQFTAFCILKLMETGKLNLDMTVFGPGGVLADEYPTVSQKASQVTIKHLLSHTSGWVSDPDPMFTSSFAGKSLDERITYMLSSPQSTPGTVFSYYNMGFGVLGKVIEKVSGKDFETYLREQLALAGINDVHVGGNRANRRSNEVIYYSQSGTDGYANDMEVIKAAGGIIASPIEMLTLAHQLDGYSSIPDIVSAQTRNMMITPPFPSVTNRYGLGWRLNHTYYPNAIYHAGNLAGTSTMWVVGENLNIVVLCNSRSYISTFDDEMYGLLKDMRTLAGSINW